MTSDERFYFSMLRISMMQLLKAHGFDKTKPRALDVLTDLYVRYLERLIGEVRKLALDRGDLDEEVALQDITQGLLNAGVFKPFNVLDVYDEDPLSPADEGIQKFKKWMLEDPSTVDARVISQPTAELLKVGETSNKPLSMIPEYMNQLNISEKKNNEGDDETELIDGMISNGDMEDWIRFVLANQKIESARRKTGKLPKNVSSLPPIPGFKSSRLSRTRNTINTSCIPVGIEIQDEEEHDEATPDEINRQKLLEKLVSKLPVGNPDNKLVNITVSYEEDTEEYETNNIIDVPDATFADIDDRQDFDFEDAQTGGLTLGHIDTTELNEMEDMHNTFERRTSLDYGHPFDI